MIGGSRFAHEAAAIVQAAADLGGYRIEELTAGGVAPREIRIARWAVIAEMRARGYYFAEIGRVLGMDHTSIMNAERRILEVQDLCTARGLTLRQYRDHIAETVKRRAPRNVLLFDGELLALRPKGKTDNGVQIWEVDRGE